MTRPHIAILSAIVFSCVLAPEKSNAGQLTTGFDFCLAISGNVSQLSFPTPQGKRITLPAALDNWNCEITDAFFSNDGKSVYHNVVCADTNTTIAVGMSVVCPRFTIGGDVNGFFIRTFAENNTSVSVQFVGECFTSHSGITPPRPTGTVL